MEREIVMDQNAHNAEIMRNLNSFRKNKIHCDFTIKVGSEEMPVHRNVLSAGSDYFKAMLAHDTKESQSGIVIIKECNPVCVTKCVDFIYTGTGSVSDENRQELMRVAHMLQLQRLCDGIALFLEKDLNSESFFSTKRIAKMFDCQNLQNHCNEFALENFCSVALSEDFKHLDMDDISYMIKAERAKASVADKCKALIIWTQHEPDDRVKFFEEIFKTLDLSKLRFEYAKYLVESESLVSNSLFCVKLLFSTVNNRESIKARDHTLTQVRSVENNNVVAVFDKTSKSIQVFNPDLKTWTKMANVSNDIFAQQFVAVVLHDDIYVLGYTKGSHCLRNYSDSSSTWERLPDRKTNGRLRAVALKGMIYAFDDCSPSSSIVEKFDPSMNSWNQVTKKTVPAWGCAVVATKDYIYCIGGYVGQRSSLRNNLRLDPNILEWRTMPDMQSGRCFVSAVELNDKIYVLGGSPYSGHLATAVCFDTATEAWTSIANMNHARSYLGSCVVRDGIYVIGGYGNNTIEEYDLVQNKWNVVGSITGKSTDPEASIALSSPT